MDPPCDPGSLGLLQPDEPRLSFTFHADEPIKVEFIQHWTQNFYHPLLMLQLVRGANMVFHLTNPLDVAVLGRSLLGLCATVTVFLSYVAARLHNRRAEITDAHYRELFTLPY